METCREHVREQDHLEESDFEAFEQECLEQDGLALVEYATMLQAAGCVLSLSMGGGAGGGHRRRRLRELLRRLQQVGLEQRIGVSSPGCSWDEMDDIARDVDACVHWTTAPRFFASVPARLKQACFVQGLLRSRHRLCHRDWWLSKHLHSSVCGCHAFVQDDLWSHVGHDSRRPG